MTRVTVNVASRTWFRDGSRIPADARYSPNMVSKEGSLPTRFVFEGTQLPTAVHAFHFKDHPSNPSLFVLGGEGDVFEVCKCCVRKGNQ